MYTSHETIRDDILTRVKFSLIETTNQLLTPHWHSHLELICIIRGRMRAYIDENSYDLTDQDILIINARDIHYTQTYDNCRYFLLQIPSIHLERLGADWELIHFYEYLPHSGVDAALNRQLNERILELSNLHESNEKGASLLFLSRLYELLYLLYTRSSSLLTAESKSRTRRDFERIEQSMQYVKQHYREPISLSEVADTLSLSTEYFCRLFKKYTGQTFLTYVSQIRTMYFYHDLIQSTESVTFLLEQNGITNYKAFMRDFKKTYGTTPLKLRHTLASKQS